MLSSLVEQGRDFVAHSGLEGARVVLTGVRRGAGTLLATSLAQAGARLIVQSPGRAPDIRALAASLHASRAGIVFETVRFGSGAAAVRFTQAAARRLGGLDAVINVIAMSAAERALALACDDVEEAIHDLLLPAALITRVAANRMRTTLREGSVVNILALVAPATGADAAFAGFARTALAAMTRIEAQEWASSGIRVNAISSSPGVCGEALAAREAVSSPGDMAALALTLVSRPGKAISGHTLDAAAMCRRRL